MLGGAWYGGQAHDASRLGTEVTERRSSKGTGGLGRVWLVKAVEVWVGMVRRGGAWHCMAVSE